MSESPSAFYDRAYAREGPEGQRLGRWRALGAVGKADHVLALCARAGVEPSSTLEVGCGDGALLAELHTRGFGGKLHGLEISEAAAELAGRRPGIESVRRYDGEHLPERDGAHDLGVVSHVLEHVGDPASVLAEVARVCRAIVVEVPLERNLSARRSAKRAQAQEIGHLQRLSRSSMRGMIARAQLELVAELEDPWPLALHTFFADTRREQAAARLKWLTRRAVHRVSPALARQLFTVHYACLCRPAASARANASAIAS